MLRIYILFLTWIFTCSIAISQDAIIQGTVTDGETNEPLISVTIKVGDSGTLTDYDGKYELQLAPGTYELEYSYVGYNTIKKEISVQAGDQQTLDLVMEQEATLLNTATVTSGKHEKPLSEVTVSLEVLKPDLVEDVNTVTLDKVLDKIPGVQMVGQQANIRGGSGFSYGAGSRVLLLVDDIPYLTSDAGSPNWLDIPIENMDQIEVLKGASSALYGSSALNGIINVRTGYAKSKPELKAAMFHNVFLSPADTSRQWWTHMPSISGASILYKRKFGPLDVVFSSFTQNESSFNQGETEHQFRLSLNTRYRITDKLSVGVNALMNDGRGGDFFYWLNGEEGAYQGSPNAYSYTERFRYSLDPFITYFDNTGNRHKFLGRYFSVDNRSNNNQSTSSYLSYGEYQFQRDFKDIDLIATAGIVGSMTNVEAELYGDTTYSSNNLAAYAQLEKKVFNKLNLSAGFRYERNQLDNPGFIYQKGFELDTVPPSLETEAKPVFRFGANWEVAEYTFLRASWGQGYRYPVIAEKYIRTTFGPVPITPNPELQSETGWSAELGIKQGFRVADFEGFLDIAAFITKYQNMMEFTFVDFTNAGFQSRNVGGTDIQGLDISVQGRGELFGLPTTLWAGYTYIDPQFSEFDNTPISGVDDPNATEGRINALNSSVDYNILKYRTKHNFKLDLQTNINKVSVGFEVFAVSHMEAIDAIFEALVVPGLTGFREENGNGYQLFNMRIAYNFTDRQAISVNFRNIFNEVYSVRPGLLEAPRNLSFRLDYGF